MGHVPGATGAARNLLPNIAFISCNSKTFGDSLFFSVLEGSRFDIHKESHILILLDGTLNNVLLDKNLDSAKAESRKLWETWCSNTMITCSNNNKSVIRYVTEWKRLISKAQGIVESQQLIKNYDINIYPRPKSLPSCASYQSRVQADPDLLEISIVYGPQGP